MFFIPLLISTVAAAALFVDALSSRSGELARVGCLSNERRIATALLLYAQDHDSCLPIPDYQAESAAGKFWKHWLISLRPYMAQGQSQTCPDAATSLAKEAKHGYIFDASYALNNRFFGVFGAGAFPMDNLELSAQTALMTETNPFGYHQSAQAPERTVINARYFDASSMPAAYRGRHDGRINVAAADGHVVSLKLPPSGRIGHDPIYGNLAGSIYNWNGGHRNGELTGPPLD